MSNAIPQLNPHQAMLACLTLVMAVNGAPSTKARALLMRLCAATRGFAIIIEKDTIQNEAQMEAMTLDILSAPDGMNTLLELATPVLTMEARQLTYALAVDFVLANNKLTPEEMRVLDILADTFKLDKLTRAAIDRAAQIRLQPYF